MSSGETEVKLVVGVGASAGGLEAFNELFSVLPPDTGMTFLLVQHLDPHHKSLLSELLAKRTEMQVAEAEAGVKLQANHVYVIRPDTALGVRNGRIELSEPEFSRGVRTPVDHLFRSLARDCGPRAVGIVLSGAGRDGSCGLRAIKGAGGLTIAQEPASSGQAGMPRSAIETGLVDLVLDIDDMPDALLRFAALPPGDQAGLSNAEPEEHHDSARRLEETDIGRIASVLQAQRGFDLRVYKPGTVERRVVRRMMLAGFEDLSSYLDRLRNDEAEQQALQRDLLISVTDFFRDPDAFEVLREKVIEPWVDGATPGGTLRVWVPGCATGEEAYSIGIELLDAFRARDKRLSLQVFATDVDRRALDVARAGLYPFSIAERMSRRRLEAYFTPVRDKGMQVRPFLRDTISFALHDLTKDPPFSRLGLVSCRNVLIYLTAEAQKHVLKLLHFALEPGGHLLLSTSESTGAKRELFATVSKPHRIYRKVGETGPISLPSNPGGVTQQRQQELSARDSTPRANRRPAVSDRARNTVLAAWVPPTVVVSAYGSVIFLHGELGPFLQFPQGESPRFELDALVRPELATRVRGAIYKCRRDDEPVVALCRPDGEVSRLVRITAKPAGELGDGAVMLSFEIVESEGAESSASQGSPERDVIIDGLERELQATREDLQNTVEELESSNEELRSSNEETMTMNEELQSANEELEATTEELRSLNEELTTVNGQLREKVAQLEEASDALNNFFASTKIATVFLDERLRVKRFTPAAQELLAVDHADTGRRVNDIARELLQNDLEREALDVLEHFGSSSREIRTRGERFVVRTVRPYRTEHRRIEGVVITFTDVTELRAANAELERKSRRLELAWEAARGGIYEHRIPLDETTYHSEQWAQILGFKQIELPSHDRFRSWLNERAHPDDRERFGRGYEDFIEGRSEVYEAELRLRHRDGHWVWVRKVSQALQRDADGRVCHLVGMMLDISDLKWTQVELRESEARFREMADGLPLLVWVHDSNGQQEYVNRTFREYFDISREATKGGTWRMLLHPDDVEQYTREFEACVRDRRAFQGETRVKNADGEWRWLESWGRPRLTSEGEFRGMVGASADITDRKLVEQALRDEEERFRTLADNIAQLAWMADGDGSIFWFNKRWFDYTGTTLEQVRGTGWTTAVAPDHVELVKEKMTRCFGRGEIWEDTFPLRRADGAYRWFLSRALPIHDDGGKVVRWFGTHTDITNRREMEEKLKEADHQKDVFLAMLGHELRNPLASITNAAELLSDHAAREPKLESTRKVLERQSAHMAKLLDGLLDVSRIIWGKIEIERRPQDLTDVCREAIEDVASQNKGRRLEVEADLPSEVVWVEGDSVRLRQVIDNLLTNAYKFTPDGGAIRVVLRQEGGWASFSVRDTGVGISPKLLPHVYEAFRQSDQSIDRAAGGLGLGLSLVRSLVELHGGTVSADSAGEGQGATFSFRLPTAEAPSGRRRGSLVPPGPLRILIVEDDQDLALMTEHVLRRAGHEVEVAYDGSAGVAAAEAKTPDVVLCDLGLPGEMNGFDVARRLRENAGTRDAYIVAVSGYGRKQDKQQSEEAGFDLHVTKPINMKDLLRLLARRDRA